MPLRVKGWEKFQHYKDRRPPWIKLYNEVLDDYDFGRLPDASKWHLIAIWLLASRTDNAIPDDERWLARMIGAHEPVDIQSLVSAGFVERYGDASTSLAKRSVFAMPETETEAEAEAKAEAAAPALFAEPDHQAAYERLRAGVRSVVGFDAGLKAIASGMHGPAYPWPTIGQALVEMDAAAAKPTPEVIRAFCRKLAALPKPAGPSSTEPLEYGVF